MVQKHMGPQGTLLFFQRTVQIACNNFKTYTLWNDFVLQRYISFLGLIYFTPVKQTSGTAGFYRIILKLFSQSNQSHSYSTRIPQAYRLPYCRTNTKKFSPFFQGPKFFNSLDNEVINSQSLFSYKKKLKMKLLSKYGNSSKIFPSSTFRHFLINWC